VWGSEWRLCQVTSRKPGSAGSSESKVAKADAVHAAAKIVEHLIDEGGDATAELLELEIVLGTLIGAMPSPNPLNAGAASTAPAVSVEELLPLLDRLQALLAEYNAEAVDVVEEIEERVTTGATRRSLRKIGECVDDFEFEEALELLRTLREELS